jgi:uncharacterized protein (TIGR03084 family)
MLGENFLQECVALQELVDGLDNAAFARVTDFYGWTVRDEILHLYFLDGLTLMALEQEDAFLQEVATIRIWQKTAELSDYMRKQYTAFDRAALIAAWRETYQRLAAVFAQSDPKARMKWFGPDMSVMAATSARQMEVWAHGQDLYDLFGIQRVNTDRIKFISELGVRTFGWTFRNRGLELPGAPPEVILTAPSGAVWRWNEGEISGSITGPAADFAAVVTQRRHVDDTRLVVQGEAARNWMLLAQCFAGAPSAGPPARGAELMPVSA